MVMRMLLATPSVVNAALWGQRNVADVDPSTNGNDHSDARTDGHTDEDADAKAADENAEAGDAPADTRAAHSLHVAECWLGEHGDRV